MNGTVGNGTVGGIAALHRALHHRDPFTAAHCGRIGRMARELGGRCGLRGAELALVEAAASIHDLGKIAVPDTILRKPGPLTAEEFEFVKTHPTIGAEIVLQLDDPVCEDLAVYVQHHHERFDGTGYPAGLRGAEIPLGARVLAVVDAFDAMVSWRPYAAQLPVPEVLELIRREKETHFDPAVADAFLVMHG